MYGLALQLRALFSAIFAAICLLFCPAGHALVISQVYGGGGNDGAPYANDFIEIFNDSAASVNLDGHSVQYASASGNSWQSTILSGPLGPYRYYLVQEAAGSGMFSALPTADVAGGIHLGASSGMVALVDGTAPLMSGCPSVSIVDPNVSILDLVGYGSANCYEGTAAVAGLSNALAALRLLDGLTDTGDNAGDFLVLAPAPRNSASPQNLPVVTLPGPRATPLSEPPSLVLMLAGIIALPWLRRIRSSR